MISIVFIVLLAGYALAGEGFGVHGRAVTFTILDEATKQAATRGGRLDVRRRHDARRAACASVGTSRCFPIGPTGTGTRERLALDLTEAQRYSAGVLQARAPTNIEQVIFRPARERLTFTRGADGVSVVNGLDATADAPRLSRRRRGCTALDGPLAPGGKQTLTTGAVDPRQMVTGDAADRRQVRASSSSSSRRARTSRCSIARRSGSRASPTCMERGSFHLVLGWPEGQR